MRQGKLIRKSYENRRDSDKIMVQSPYKVEKFSIEKLLELISKNSRISLDDLSCKPHARYFRSYFETVQAKTIVVEYDYVDHDYLEDYAAYYVRCFREYKSKCTRLHFFSTKFTPTAFSNLLKKKQGHLTAESLQERGCYLGFMVIRDLPQTVIGRTCVVTYPPNGGRRHFPVVREYNSNLFGIPFRMKSLAFQEQDRAVAACATSALWTAFQSTGKQFQHIIPAPVEITRMANEKFPLRWRAMPSTGLSIEQMAGSIRSVGLDPYTIKTVELDMFRNVLYGYLRGGIPVLLLFQMAFSENGTSYKIRGSPHAVTVIGYSMGETPAFSSNDQLRLRSGRIDKIYVHDDQVGPFARMVLDGVPIVDCENHLLGPSISSAWYDSERAIPRHLLVPLYPKIRIPYEPVHKAVESFNMLLNRIAKWDSSVIGGDREWDLHLTCLNDYRNYILEESPLDGDCAKNILCDTYPRFMWRAAFLLNGTMKFDLLFDATDVEQGYFFHRAVEYDPKISIYLREVLKNRFVEAAMKQTAGWQIIKWFRDYQ